MSDLPELPETGFNVSGSAALEIIDRYLNSIIKGGYTQTEAARIFRNAGLHFSNANLSQAWRDSLGIGFIRDRLNALPGSSQIPDNLYQSPDFYMASDRRFVVSYETYNPDTGKIDTRYTTVDTPELTYGDGTEYSIDDYTEVFLDFINEYEFEVVSNSIRFDKAYRR